MSFPREHRQILDMLAEGKITPDEAQRLMEKIAANTTTTAQADPDPSTDSPTSDGAGALTKAFVLQTHSSESNGSQKSGSALRYLRILVNSSDGDEVNIRVPLQLVRAGLKLSTVLPNDAKEKIHESGIDLSKLSELEGEALIEALRDLSVDVDSSDGDVVRIFCE